MTILVQNVSDFLGQEVVNLTSYSKVMDYVHRPVGLSEVCLYDWIRYSEKKKMSSKDVEDAKTSIKGNDDESVEFVATRLFRADIHNT